MSGGDERTPRPSRRWVQLGLCTSGVAVLAASLAWGWSHRNAWGEPSVRPGWSMAGTLLVWLGITTRMWSRKAARFTRVFVFSFAAVLAGLWVALVLVGRP